MKLMNMTSTMTMTSLEVVEVINGLREDGKPVLQHNTFMAKVRSLQVELGLSSILQSSYKNSQNKKQPMLLLDKETCLLMVASETPKVLQAIIKRWQELENQSKPAMPTTYIAALEALIASEKAKELALLQVDELQVELDESKAYCTIKRFAFFNKVDWKDLSWKKLKAAHIRITGEDVHKIFDANFPEGVNAYHKEAFAEVYPTLEYPDIV